MALRSTDSADYKGRKQRAESRKQKAESREQKAESRKQKAESRKQKAESREQKAESRKQKAGKRKQKADCLLPMPFVLCLCNLRNLRNLWIGDEAAASSPPRRPVGTGSLPMSEQEAVPDINHSLASVQSNVQNKEPGFRVSGP